MITIHHVWRLICWYLCETASNQVRLRVSDFLT